MYGESFIEAIKKYADEQGIRQTSGVKREMDRNSVESSLVGIILQDSQRIVPKVVVNGIEYSWERNYWSGRD